MNDQPNRNRQIVASITVLVVIAVIVAWATLAANQDSSADTSEASSSSQTQTASNSSSVADTSTAESSGEYTDGTYKATGSYSSPGGTEEITTSLTLADGVITDTSAESGADNNDSKSYQADFISGYAELILGKNIDDVSLSRVAGSSLTPIGFNNALEQIKSEAQS